MKNKIFYHIITFVITMMCGIFGLVYAFDGLDFVELVNLSTEVSFSTFIFILLLILDIFGLITSLLLFILSFFNNKESNKFLKLLHICNLVILLFSVFWIVLYMLENRPSIENLLELGMENTKEEEILEASLNSIASIYVIPSFIASLFALILNILPYLIHQSDNQTFEIELPEELMNKKSTPTDNLEDKVSRLEDKIKYEKLLIEYEELLHRSKKE